MPRPYRQFPYIEVLTDLLAGKGYRETAEKFGYLELDKPDPTKSFRTLVRHARNKGFEHQGERVIYPRFSRDGQPVFGPGEMTPLMKSLLPVGATRIKKPRPKRKADPSGLAKVKVVDVLPKGRHQANTLYVILNPDKTTVTLKVPGPDTVVSLEELLKALKPEPPPAKSSLFSDEEIDDLDTFREPPRAYAKPPEKPKLPPAPKKQLIWDNGWKIVPKH
jgi:hypothetical protein